MNSVILIGRLSNEPTISYTGQQMAICKFNMAIDRGKDAQGNDKGDDFPRITVFGKQGENAEKYLNKGRLCAVQGRVQTGSYKDKDGKTIYTTDIVADRVEFLEFGDKPKQEAPKPQVEEQQEFLAVNESVPW